MTAFATGRDARLDYRRSNGSAVDALLRPAASEDGIAALERGIGLALPPHLVSLWRCADGQVDPVMIDDPAPGAIVSLDREDGGPPWVCFAMER